MAREETRAAGRTLASLLLPFEAVEGLGGGPVRAAAPCEHDPARASPLRVLVVDDDAEDLRRAVEAHADATVVAIATAVEAMARERPAAYDLCLLGYDLSGLDGMTLGVMMRELNPAVRLVLIGGQEDPRVEELAMEHGFCAVLTRPVQQSDIETLMNE